MRVLWCTTPMESVMAFGLPVAQAMREAGHEVLVATGPDFQERLRDLGFDTAVAGPTAMEGAMTAMMDEAVVNAPPGESWHFGAAMFGGVIAPAKFPVVRDLAEDWEPDLVLHPPVDLAAPLLAAVVGVPSVTYGFGQYLEQAFVESLATRVEPLWRAAGVDPDPAAGIYRGVYLDPCPPSLQRGWRPPAVRARHVALPVPGDRDAQLPGWTAALDERPLVYISLGTVPMFNQPDKFKALLEPFREHRDVEIVVTVGNLNDPSAVGDQPAHIHVEQWVPLAAILPRCRAVVCHGGSGTTLAALTEGLPLVLLPQGADQHANASACAAAGVARVIDPDDTGALRPAVLGVVEPGSEEAAAARRLASEIATLPLPRDVVADLGVALPVE